MITDTTVTADAIYKLQTIFFRDISCRISTESRMHELNHDLQNLSFPDSVRYPLILSERNFAERILEARWILGELMIDHASSTCYPHESPEEIVYFLTIPEKSSPAYALRCSNCDDTAVIEKIHSDALKDYVALRPTRLSQICENLKIEGGPDHD